MGLEPGRQGAPHREVFRIQLIEIQAARNHVDAVIPHVGEVNHIVRCRRVLEPVHPLLDIVGLAVGETALVLNPTLVKPPKEFPTTGTRPLGKRIAQHAAWARRYAAIESTQHKACRN